MYQIRLSKLPLIEYKLKIINVVRVGYNRNILNCFFLMETFIFGQKYLCPNQILSVQKFERSKSVWPENIYYNSNSIIDS